MEQSTTPLLRLWGKLVVPLQGDLSDSQASALMERILHTLRKSDSTGLVIDVSGVPSIDSHLCSLLLKVSAASKLMGAQMLLSGISPEVALTLQSMGVQFGDVKTARGLEEALEELGLRVEDTTAEDPWELLDQLTKEQ
jgi:rsbT antagonist protein RsbS